MRLLRRSALLLTFAALLAVGLPSQALTAYTDVISTNYSFTGIQEASTFGDPEPLFDQPLDGGDRLEFFPPDFSAESVGGGFDATGAQLQAMIEGNTLSDVIDTITIEEFGDATLAGFGGTLATGAALGLSGFITVLEVNGVGVAPTVISFGPAGSGADVIVSFTPPDVDVNTGGLGLPADLGVTVWSASVTIDVASVVADVTKVQLSMDNDLFASSEATTSSKIQKKVVDGPSVIITVPEPGSVVLLGSLCLGLALRARGRS